MKCYLSFGSELKNDQELFEPGTHPQVNLMLLFTMLDMRLQISLALRKVLSKTMIQIRVDSSLHMDKPYISVIRHRVQHITASH